MSAELTKVDSAVAGLSISAKDEKAPDTDAKKGHKRSGSQSEGVWNIKDLEEQKIELELPIETQKLGCIDDKDYLKLHLVTPPVKKIDLIFPLGLSVTARNLKGVTIKDAMDAIYKQFKKKSDDEMEKPYLAGFEWDKDESWTRLIVHQKKEGAPQPTGKKSKKKKNENA
ncbi:hypothetical protein PHISP_01331 [Aspergillus sp. HF37]|nr:hypothetical protein PHISP_01331 [Aspergillus sp. HF37]